MVCLTPEKCYPRQITSEQLALPSAIWLLPALTYREASVKLMTCNGRELTVRDCGPILMRLAAQPGGMVRRHGTQVLSDDDARAVVRSLLAEGCVRVE